MNPEQILLLWGGLVLLTAGFEFLVRGASRLAGIAGMSPLYGVRPEDLRKNADCRSLSVRG